MRARSWLAATVAVTAMGACVSPNEAGVSIDSIEADVVFGVEEEPALPANTDVDALPPGAEDGGFEFPAFRNPAADRLPPLRPTAEQAEEICPTAPPTAAAEKPAEVDVTGSPEEGIYLWKRTGTQTTFVEGVEEPVQKQITGFERRIIQNVEPYDDPFDEEAYTFEMVQTLLDRPVVQIRTFLVKPQTSAQYAPGGAMVVDEPRVNEPEGGVSLVKVEEFDENDQAIGRFEPSNGLLLLGLPVDPAETFQSTATDPRTGQTIVQDAAVRGRTRIDACGELVDGWRVETTQSRSDAAGSVGYNLVIATQYGGVPILEEITTVGGDGSELNVTFSLGQVHPDPLPADG